MRHNSRPVRRPKFNAEFREMQRIALQLADAATAAAMQEFRALADASLVLAPQYTEEMVAL